MDISPAGVAATQQALLQNAVATSVLRKSLDIQTEQGAALVQMMSQSQGLGRSFDQYA